MISAPFKALGFAAGLATCFGLSAQTLTPRIVDGVNTTPQAHPSYVTILAGGSLCGGTLIDSRWVLTAAHCLESGGTPVNTQFISVGISPTGSAGSSINASDWVDADLFYLHPQYKFPAHDIALIQLSRAVSGHKATLGSYTNHLVGTIGTVVGMGSTTRQMPEAEVTDAIPAQLQQTNVPIVANGVCSTYYGSTPENLICGGYSTNPSSEACKGDSGGPLYIEQNGQKLQAGIVSFGSGCGVGNPGGYVPVAAYESYIKQYVPNAAFAGTTNNVVSDVTGSWYDPNYNGVGFNFVQAGSTLSAVYYGYRNDGLPQWLLSTTTYNQDIVKNTPITLSMNTSTRNNGATFTVAPQTASSGTSYWGNVTLQFSSCSTGSATLSGADGTVTYQLTKLVNPKNLSCSD